MTQVLFQPVGWRIEHDDSDDAAALAEATSAALAMTLLNRYFRYLSG